MLLKSRGIVFRAIKYAESSLIVDIYTREKGIKKYIISGVRTQKAKVHANLFQVMTLLDIVGYDRPDKDLNRLKEVHNAYIYQNIPFNIVKSASGMFMLEVARKAIQESEPNPELFDFLANTFQFLDTTSTSVANLPLLFMIDLSTFLGFTPQLDHAEQECFFDLKEGIFLEEVPPHDYYLSQEDTQIFIQLLDANQQTIHEVKMAKAQRQEMLKHLLNYYQLHIDNFPLINAHLILREVLG